MVLLLTLTLTACSPEYIEEVPVNGEGSQPFTDEEIYAYLDEHEFEIPMILNTSDNDYAAILGNNELHQLHKDENDEMVSEVLQIGDGDVEFGALNGIIYVIVRDEELLEAGERLDIEHDNGAFSSEFVLIDEKGIYSTIYDSDRRIDGTVNDARLIIYDSEGNSIYEQDLE